MKQISMFLALFCMALQGNAQFVLKGTVTDTGKNPLTGAHIVLKDTNYKTTADNQGNFSFTGIKKGKYLMQVTFVGFENVRRSLVITRDTELVFILNESAVVSDVVIVSAVR